MDIQAEPLLVQQESMDRPRQLCLAAGRAAVFSRSSPAKSSANEDCAAVIPLGPEAVVLVVADGMGGGAVGECASATAVQTVVDFVRRADRGDPRQLRFAIINALEQANLTIQEQFPGAATTIAVVEIQQQVARPYHVGDSLILLVGNRGRIKIKSFAHSPVGYAIRSGELDEDEAMLHHERHLVSNMVGMPDMSIEIGGPVPMAPLDTILLASDGLSDNLRPDEIVESVRKGALPRTARKLAQDVVQRMVSGSEGLPGKPDDLTFVLFRRHRASSGRDDTPAG